MDEALPFCRGCLRSRSDLSQVDFRWALWKTQKAAAFSQKAKKYLLDVWWTGEETSKATASNVASQISSLRDDIGQKCCLRLTG